MVRRGLTLVILIAVIAVLTGTALWYYRHVSGYRVPRGTSVYRSLPYVSHGTPNQTLDLYIPPGAGPKPLAIWVHGGSWSSGTKDDPLVISLLAQGYALASVDYRLTPAVVYPAPLEDCKAAVRWLRAHAVTYGLDPNRFAAIGSSAGGHLVALLGTTRHVRDYDVGDNLQMSSRVNAVVDLFGPVDLTPGSLQVLEVAVDRLLGDSLNEREALALRASPVTWVTKDAAPFLIIHGDADQVVPYQQSLLLRHRLEEVGVPTEFHLLAGGEHNSETVMRALPVIERFLHKWLSPGKQTPAATGTVAERLRYNQIRGE